MVLQVLCFLLTRSAGHCCRVSCVHLLWALQTCQETTIAKCISLKSMCNESRKCWHIITENRFSHTTGHIGFWIDQRFFIWLRVADLPRNTTHQIAPHTTRQFVHQLLVFLVIDLEWDVFKTTYNNAHASDKLISMYFKLMEQCISTECVSVNNADLL